MLDENTVLITTVNGPYTAIGYSGTKEEIAQTLNPFYNMGAFEGEIIFQSEVFGYVTGPHENVIRGLVRHFELRQMVEGKQYKRLKGKRRETAVRAAKKVWANRKVEHFLNDAPVSNKEYSWPSFE